MCLQPPHGSDGPAVGLQRRFPGKKPLHRLVRDGDDLRCGKGGCARNGHIHAHGLAPHVEIKAVCGVLVQLLGRIPHQLGQAHRQFVAQPVIRQQPLRTLAQMPGIGGNLLRHLLQRFIFRFPCLIGGEDILQPPGVLFRHFCPNRYFLFCHVFYLPPCFHLPAPSIPFFSSGYNSVGYISGRFTCHAAYTKK